MFCECRIGFGQLLAYGLDRQAGYWNAQRGFGLRRNEQDDRFHPLGNRQQHTDVLPASSLNYQGISASLGGNVTALPHSLVDERLMLLLIALAADLFPHLTLRIGAQFG